MTISTPLPLTIDRASRTVLSRQLSVQIRQLIVDGTLVAGDRLPSSRALAADLGVARAVAEVTYDQLLAEGWLEARRGSGTFVAANGTPTLGTMPAADRPVSPPRPALMRLSTGHPWIDPRHQAGWRRAWRDVSVSPIPGDYPAAGGEPEVRAAVAAYLGRTRGLVCTADDVMITSGTTDGLRRVLDVLDPGAVAIEDPGYRAAVAVSRAAGRVVRDLAIDAEGVSVEQLRALGDDVRAVYVTPAHQHPTGVTMTAARRVALLEECRRRNAVIVEDDYDSEFRYDVAPLPALATLDRERVIHLGTTSKSISPTLRMGWVVAPAALIDRMIGRAEMTHDMPSWPVQRAWLSMLRDGHADKLVRSARRVYAVRAAKIEAALSPYVRITGPVAGMYLTVELAPAVVDVVRARCAAAGFDVPSLADYSRTSGRAGLLIGFGGLTDAQLDRVLAALTAALRPSTA